MMADTSPRLTTNSVWSTCRPDAPDSRTERADARVNAALSAAMQAVPITLSDRRVFIVCNLCIPSVRPVH